MIHADVHFRVTDIFMIETALSVDSSCTSNYRAPSTVVFGAATRGNEISGSIKLEYECEDYSDPWQYVSDPSSVPPKIVGKSTDCVAIPKRKTGSMVPETTCVASSSTATTNCPLLKLELEGVATIPFGGITAVAKQLVEANKVGTNGP